MRAISTNPTVVTVMLVIALLSTAFVLACSDGHILAAGPIRDICSVMTHAFGTASAVVAPALLALLFMVATMAQARSALPVRHGPLLLERPSGTTRRSYEERSQRLRL